jgi:hypothetical protein
LSFLDSAGLTLSGLMFSLRSISTKVSMEDSGLTRRGPPAVYAEAPLMKNHLSIEASIFSAGSSWLAGIGGSWSGETRAGEWLTVRLVLDRTGQHVIVTMGEA